MGIPKIAKSALYIGLIAGAVYVTGDYYARQEKSYWSQFTKGVAIKFNQGQAYITKRDGKSVNVDLSVIPTVELVREVSKRDPRDIVAQKKVVKGELETMVAKEDAKKVEQKIKQY